MNSENKQVKKISNTSYFGIGCLGLGFFFLILIMLSILMFNVIKVNHTEIKKTTEISKEIKEKDTNIQEKSDNENTQEKEEIQENIIDSIHDISFNADDQMKFGVGILATDQEGYMVENFDDFTVDKDGNLPSVVSRIKVENKEYNGYQPYKLDLSKKEDKRVYEAIQFIHEGFLKRIPNSSNLVKQFTYSIYKKDNLFKIVVGGISDEDKEIYFYLGKIEFDYLYQDDKYFGGYIDKNGISERGYGQIIKSSGKIEKFEDPKFSDSDEILTKKMNDFLYSYAYNNSDIQKGNTLFFNLEKSDTFEKDGQKLVCFQGDIEDLTYGYKVKTGNMCIVFQNNEFIGYSNQMNY